MHMPQYVYWREGNFRYFTKSHIGSSVPFQLHCNYQAYIEKVLRFIYIQRGDPQYVDNCVEYLREQYIHDKLHQLLDSNLNDSYEIFMRLFQEAKNTHYQ